MQQVCAVILGGGQGTRLSPLTQFRSKPAINFGGYYHLIDFALSNAINSGCQQINVITQFYSTSLQAHIYQNYVQNLLKRNYVRLLPAEEKHAHRQWLSGTADAVRQSIHYLLESPSDYFLILSGDQLYQINFQEMLDFAFQTDADLTIASTPVEKETAKRLGILQIDGQYRVTRFVEKPQEESVLDDFLIPSPLLRALNCSKKPCLASMGIYLFKREALIKLLREDPREDFGKHLIPTKVSQGKVSSFVHKGYWEDIGTIRSFHQANIALTGECSHFDLYNEKWPIYGSFPHLPGPKVLDTSLKQAILCSGSIVEADEVTQSIIGPRAILKKGCIIRNSYLMGNDFYTPPKYSTLPSSLSVGENTIIFDALIDNHVSIGSNVQLVNKEKLNHFDSENVYIREGIIVVPNGSTIPDGFVL